MWWHTLLVDKNALKQKSSLCDWCLWPVNHGSLRRLLLASNIHAGTTRLVQVNHQLFTLQEHAYKEIPWPKLNQPPLWISEHPRSPRIAYMKLLDNVLHKGASIQNLLKKRTTNLAWLLIRQIIRSVDKKYISFLLIWFPKVVLGTKSPPNGNAIMHKCTITIVM